MNTAPDTKLDAALSKLPRDIEPARDLWPGIVARIGARPVRVWPHTIGNLAAAAAVIAVAVIIAWTVSPTRAPSPVATPLTAAAPSAPDMPTASSDPRALFVARLARDRSMPVNARTALLDNLRMLDADIARTEAAVKKYPDDVNLRALLFNLYQQQARLLDDAQRAQIQTSTRTAL